MELALIHKIIVILLNAIGIWLAFWVLSADRKSKVNRYFFLMVVFWIFVNNTYYLMKWVLPLNYAFLSYKLGIVSSFFSLIFFYLFSAYFLGEGKRFPVLNKLVPLIGIIGAFLAFFTNFIAKGIEIAEYGRNPLLTVGGKIIFLGYATFLAVFILIWFLKSYFRSSPEKKLSIQYFLIGFSLFIILNLYTNVFLWGIKDSLEYSYIGNYSIVLMFFFTGLAIVKQQLFGIKIILTQFLVGVIGIVLLIVPFLTQIFWFRVLLFAIFLLFCLIGYFLIKYTLREVRQREILEQKVQERTKELRGAYENIKKRKEDLEKFYKLTVGRELRMIELKKKIKEIEEKMKEGKG